MTDEAGYNGWKNYETWVTALWIDNDEGSYKESRALVESARIDATDEREEWWSDEMAANRIIFRAADFLEAWVEQDFQDCVAEMAEGHRVFGDLLGYAFGQVDWYEIAENYLGELADV